jgi:uncharacterized membrane protein YidH (DUF202 family)
MSDSSEKRNAIKLDALKPEDIARNAAKLERDVGLSLLPAFGVLGLLGGSLWFFEAAPALKYPAMVSLAALGVTAMVMLANRSFEGAQFLLAGGFGVLLMAVLTLPGYIGLSAAVIVCLVFAIFVARQLLERTSAWVFLPFVPMSFLSLGEGPYRVRVLLALGSLALTYAVAYRGHKRMAFVALAVAVTLAVYEVNRARESRLLIGLCLTGILIAAMVYERKVPVEEQSDLRQFLGQTLVVAVLMMLVHTITKSRLSQESSTWIWALAVAAYETLRLRIEKASQPARAAWIAVAMSAAIWLPDKSIPWYLQGIANLAVAGLLQIYALRAGNRMLSDVAVALVLIAGGCAMQHTLTDGANGHTLWVSLAAASGFLLLSRREIVASRLRWWRGFVISAHYEQLEYYGGGLKKIIMIPLKRVAFLSAIIDGIVFALNWLRYCRGEKARPFADDLLFAFAVSLSCFAISHFVFAQCQLHHLPWEASVVAASIVWSVIGLAVVLYGIKQQLLFQRFLGHLCIVVPVVYALAALIDADVLDGTSAKALRAALLIQVGICLALLGIVRRKNEPNASNLDQQMPSPPESAKVN